MCWWQLSVKVIKTCEVCGESSAKVCFRKKYNKALCPKHYMQMERHGEILTYTRFDMNDIELFETHAEVVVRNKKGIEKVRAIINLNDVDKVKKHKWYNNERNYLITHDLDENGKRIRLHRLIVDAPVGMSVDHINHIVLDNRKENLRICTHKENNRNKDMYAHNTSGHKGVSWFKARNKWEAHIKVDGKSIKLGFFIDIEDAIKARQEAELKYFGKYSPLYEQLNQSEKT